MLRKSIKTLAAIAVLGLTGQAMAMQVFFSSSNVPGTETVSNPTQVASVGSVGNHIYIWAIPAAGDASVNGLSLNVRVGTAGQLANTSATINNPQSGSTTRWDPASVSPGAGNSTRGNGTGNDLKGGVYKAGGSYLSGFNGLSTNGAALGDTLRDPANGAYLIGSFNFDVLAGATGTQLFFEVGGATTANGPGANDAGAGKITNTDGTTVSTLFGAGDTTAIDASLTASKGLSSTTSGLPTFDAVITVPEPATLGLLSLGGVAGLIRRRRTA